MAQTSATSPGTMADDATIGTLAWTNPDNAKVSDNAYAVATMNYRDEVSEYAIRIVKSDGTIGTTNKSTGAYLGGVDTYHSYGSSSDLWGETWSNTDINDVDFGMVFAFEDTYLGTISHYLKATNFGFSIPSGATIDGILAEVEAGSVSDGPFGGTDYCRVDHIRITVDYTEASSSSTITGISSMTGVQSITL